NQEWSDLRERLNRTQPRQLHIALDCSLNARESEVVEQYTDVLQSIDALRNTDQSMRISCVDHASRTIIIKGRTTTNDIRKALSDLRPESAAGGFFLGRLIARDLFTLVREPENVTAPVYLIVAPSSTRAHFIEDLRQFQQVNAIELPAYVLHLQPVRSNETTSESTQPDARQRENTRSTTDTRAPTDTQQPMDTEQHRENRTIDSTTKVLPLNLLNDAVQTTDTALVAAARNQQLRPITLNDLITRLQSESAEKNSEFQQSKSDAATGLQIRFTDRDDLVQHYNFNAEPQTAQSDLYEQALLLDGLYRHHVLHPNEETVYRAVLRQSFAHRILTPLTASIALENEAQKRALLRKQEAALAGHSGLELEEKPTAMDEPDWVYLLALIFIMWLYHQRHRIAHYWRRVQPHH
ncbi:MAG: hypothetical protein KDK30_13140, partial [Leptospiraceae bacterium]|nr:hypothetical protein [Leptospiraceae bacterium]